MKLLSMETFDDYLFGSQLFDFSKNNDGITPVDTIFIVGENGAGKTHLLDLIFSLTKVSYYNLVPSDRSRKLLTFRIKISPELNEKIVQEVGLYLEEIISFDISCYISLDEKQQNNSYFISKISFLKSIDENGYDFVGISSKYEQDFLNILTVNMFQKILYSASDNYYIPGKIETVSSSDSTASINEFEKTSLNTVNAIAQLLVDMDNADAIEYRNWAKEQNSDVRVSDGNPNARLSIFNEAFETFFQNLEFDTIVSETGEKKIVFKNHSQKVYLEDLSSGERHIIFRGAFFLKNNDLIDESIFLIDEPELSLHPAWQMKIMDYYKRIAFKNGSQPSQIFAATHSPFILNGDNRYDDKVILLEKQENGLVEITANEFYSIGIKEQISDALDTSKFFQTDQLPTIYVEGITDQTYWTKAKDLFSEKNDFYQFKEIGENGKNGGESNLETAYRILSTHYPNAPMIFLFDCDCKKIPKESHENKVWRIRLSSNRLNEEIEISKGIENLLNLEPLGNKIPEKYYLDKEKLESTGYGKNKKITVPDLQKVKLSTDIVSGENAHQILSNFKEWIQKFEKILFE